MQKRSYVISVIDVLTFSASPIALPASASRALSMRLQKGGHNGGFEGQFLNLEQYLIIAPYNGCESGLTRCW